MISSKILIGPDFELFPHHAFLSKWALKMTFDFIKPSERAHFKLPDHKTVEIGPSKPKLWPLKDATFIVGVLLHMHKLQVRINCTQCDFTFGICLRSTCISPWSTRAWFFKRSSKVNLVSQLLSTHSAKLAPSLSTFDLLL